MYSVHCYLLILLELKQIEQMTHRIFHSFMQEFRFMSTELPSKGQGAHSSSVRSLNGHHKAPPAPDSGVSQETAPCPQRACQPAPETDKDSQGE